MTNKYSFIYLLILENNKIFKIGKADNIINRYETLKRGWGNFNLKNSYQIKCKENNIFKLEKTLHYIFKDFNTIPNNQNEGYTEWFDMKCYNDVINFLNDLKNINSDIIDIKQAIIIPNKIKNNIWQSLSKEDRKEKYNQYKNNKQNKNLNTNIQNATILINIFNELKNNIIFFNKEQNLIVFQNTNKDKVNLLRELHFYWDSNIFNFAGNLAFTEDLIYLDLCFNCLEEMNKIEYEEMNKPYNIIMNFFNNLDLKKIETDINIGYKYKEYKNKLFVNFAFI